MSSTLFERAMELWFEVRGLEPAERARRLEAACAGDPDLLAVLEDLLEGERHPLPGLDEPLVKMLEPVCEPVPERIGSYRILGLLEGGDAGGMGLVYRAEQEFPRREVALKVLRRELGDARSRERFREEVETLGRLEHPGIARILEGGFDPGPAGERPFFVMELVAGRPLDQWADARELGVRARVALLAQVCEAVRYAHEKGVVHCDLKPNNILVDSSGQPRVLDFGIARVVVGSGGEAGGQVRVQGVRGTPKYMCPEQRRGEPADFSWDVYALGVMGAALVGLAPTAPKSVLQGVDARSARELQAVLCQAHAEARERRYGTAADLHAELSRWVACEPTLAFGGGQLHRMVLFTRRRRGLVVTVVGAQLLLLAGLAGTTWQWHRAVKADLALKRNGRVVELLTEIITVGVPHKEMILSRDGVPVRGSVGPPLRDLLDHSEGLLSEEPLDIKGLLSKFLGNAYHSLGADEQAEQRLRIARDALTTELGQDSEEAIVATLDLATVVGAQGRYSEAVELISDASSRSKRSRGEESVLSLRCEHELGAIHLFSGDWEMAESQLEGALAGRERLLGPTHRDTLLTRGSLGVLRCEQKRFDEAEALLTTTLQAMRKVFGETHPQTLTTLNNLGTLYADQERDEEALAIAREEEAAAERVAGRMHPDTLVSRGNVAGLTGLCGRLEESETLLRELLEDCERSLPPDHPTLLQTHHYLCDILERTGKFAEAEEHGRVALEGRRRILGPVHEYTLMTANYLIAALSRQNKAVEVIEVCDRVLEDIAASPHPPEHWRSPFLNDKASCLIALDRLEEAEQAWNAALDANPAGPDQDAEQLRRSQRIEKRLAAAR